MGPDKLIEKMRAARELAVDAAGHRFTVRIPHGGELEEIAESLNGRSLTFRRVVEAAVVGWNLTELDLIPGGGPEPVLFHADLFREWLGEHGDAIDPLFKAITEGIERRRARKADDEKN